MRLPALREELALHPGPRSGDGQPGWTLHDPVRNRFFRLDWLTFEVLSRWSLDDPEAIAASVATETTLAARAEDVAAVAQFLADHELIRVGGGDSARRLAARVEATRQSWAAWLLHHYLFFRVPLLRPDRWLGRWQGVAGFFYSPRFFKLTALALVVGLIEVWRNWEPFRATLVETLSWNGLMAYALTLTGVKVLHELGHAFTAKRYGCRVPTMGVAFLVLWPVAYTDTNEAWTLADRRRRLAVDCAGVATELLIAVWATLAWAFLPDGTLRTACFMLATTTWIATLAVNLSPFMRFDGYFVLSDALDMPNLHGRAFALARWDLRERLFALGEEPPEYFSAARRRLLILFAWATWIYRLALFLGIAALVYHFFIKAVGIVLFVVEIVCFVLLPCVQEFRAWAARWPAIRASGRARRSALIALALLAAACLPLPGRIAASGRLQPAQQFAVYTPAAARLEALPWREGERVPAGAVLLTLDHPEARLRLRQAQQRLARLRWQAGTAGFSAEQRERAAVLQQELAAAEAAAQQAARQLEQYAPRAPFAGRLRDLDPDLRAGQWLGRHEAVAVLVDDGRWQVETYLVEDDARRVRRGDTARFYSEGGEGRALRLRVAEVDRDATRTLTQAQLAQPFGGTVETREKNGELIPAQAVYRVRLEVEDEPGALRGRSWRGRVVFHGRWTSPLLDYARAAAAVVRREAGF